ncbi:hypothetical protein WDU94_005460 [Cyamophila willieti]
MTLNNKIEECIDIMIERRLDIFGLSETKRKEHGNEEVRGGYHLYWSGGETCRNGVALIVSSEIKEKITEVFYISNRIIKINVKMSQKHDVVSIIQCYAPQSGCSTDDKAEFESLLEDHLKERNTIVMGDMNAQVGRVRDGYDRVMGPWGFGDQNDEGVNLIDFCMRNEMMIGNTWFRKRSSHKITRYSWDGRYKTMIDLVILTESMRQWLLDVKVIPSVSMGGDHRLLISTIIIKKPHKVVLTQEKKIKAWKLKDSNVAEQYRNRIQENIPNTDTTSVEEEWKLFKKVIIEAAEKVCGRSSGKKRTKETPWWNDETKKATTKKNSAFREHFKKRTDETKRTYRDAKKEAARVIEREKKKWYEKWEKTLQEDVDGNKKLLYGMMRDKRRDKEEQKYLVDCDGNLITEEEKIKVMWKEYFQELLNVESVTNGNNQQYVCDIHERDREQPELTWNDVDTACKFIKTGKSPGPDEITGEMLKAAGIVGKHMIYRLFKKCWDEKKIPEEWKEGIIVPLFKKGDRRVCNNYRGITLTSQVGKLYERIIELKIRPQLEVRLHEEQYGFRRGRSTVDLIFSIKQLMEKYYEYGKELWMAFLDIKKAFDAVIREKVWQSLRNIGIHEEIVERIVEIYTGTKSKVKTRMGMTENFIIESGLRQGGVLSPLLFITVMNEIQERVEHQLGKDKMKLMLFADDLFLWGDKKNEIQEQIDKWTEIAKEYGLNFSTEKSEVVILMEKTENSDSVLMDGESLKKVDNFKYLGSLISKDGAMDKELNRRIQLGSALYSCVKDLIWNTHVPLKCKKTIFQTYYIPILTYGAETWVMKTREESRVQAAEMRFLRSMIGKTRRDRIRNEIIRSRVGVDKLQDRIETSRLKWYGHVKRINEERLPNKYLEMKMEGRRKQGRPRLRWKDIINRDIVKRNQNPSLIERNQTFRDRIWWRGFVNSRPINNNRTA